MVGVVYFNTMIIRKYNDGEGNLEVSVSEDKKFLVFENERDGIVVSVYLTFDDAKDLQDRLYDLLKIIEPKKERING